MYNVYNPYNNPYFQPQSVNRGQVVDLPVGVQNGSIGALNRATGLIGKMVDSVDTVKGMDISLDGAVNYFPLANGSAIVTKQLMTDGTSKVTVYKPVDENVKEIKYATQDDIDKAIKKIDLSEIKDEIKSLKKQIKKLEDSDE